jgi:predicted nucleic acid-binding protein
MILVDTSIWVDHLRIGDELLQELLAEEQVLLHPYVYGELALGGLRHRTGTLFQLRQLPTANIAHHNEVMRLVEQEILHDVGLSYIDAHVLAATRLTPGASLWTRDKSLSAAAEKLSVAARVTH